MSKRQRDTRKYTKKVKKLRKKYNSENNKCADCSTPNPTWVSITIGVWLCMRCSNIHRNLPHTISIVKSIDLDSFTSQIYKAIKSKGGNRKLNKIYESPFMRFNFATKPNIHSDEFKLRQFILLKYYEKKWYSLKAIKTKKKRPKKQESEKEEEKEEEEEDNGSDQESEEDDDDDDEFDDFDPFSEPHSEHKQDNYKPDNDKPHEHKPDVKVKAIEAIEAIPSNNNVLMDFTQMEKANEWKNVHQLPDHNQKQDSAHVIDTLLNGSNDKNSNGKNRPNEILQRYNMNRNTMNPHNNRTVMNMDTNTHNMSSIEMKQHLHTMQMQLKQMQMKLNAQQQNTNNNNDDWADFGDTDDWGDFHDGNAINNNNNNIRF